MHNSALVVVDMLYDFIDGSLACSNADSAVAQTVKFIDRQTKGQGGEDHEILDTFPILFVRDHHPADHSSAPGLHIAWPVLMEATYTRPWHHTPVKNSPSTRAVTGTPSSIPVSKQ